MGFVAGAEVVGDVMVFVVSRVCSRRHISSVVLTFSTGFTSGSLS